MQARFYDLARSAFDAIVTGWPADPDVALPLPDRRYVAFGQIAWDCEQLVVSGLRSFITDGDVAVEQVVSGPVFFNRAVELVVSIVRCVPVVDNSGDEILFPDPDAIETSALVAFTDEETIRDVLISAQEARTLAVPGGLAFGNWVTEGPLGGLGGGTLTVRMSGL